MLYYNVSYYNILYYTIAIGTTIGAGIDDDRRRAGNGSRHRGPRGILSLLLSLLLLVVVLSL